MRANFFLSLSLVYVYMYVCILNFILITHNLVQIPCYPPQESRVENYACMFFDVPSKRQIESLNQVIEHGYYTRLRFP